MNHLNVVIPNVHIAIADDNEFLRNCLASFLTSKGFTITINAKNGQDLLLALQVSHDMPDICLIDVEMPVMNGYETLRRLRTLYPLLTIIVYALYLDEGKKQYFLEAGADAAITKGVEPKMLLDTLRKTRRALSSPRLA